MYNPHRSEPLQQAFRSKPFQGADPESAEFLFIGLDANFDEAVERTSIWPELLAYLADGVTFWKRYGKHHPFLLLGELNDGRHYQRYRGSGRFYHQEFAQIGFCPSHAAKVSFIELLHVPTCGKSRLQPSDLDEGHLSRIDRAIRCGAARHVFIPDSVSRLMRAKGMFAWLPQKPYNAPDGPDQPKYLQLWASLPAGKTVYRHYHFSTFGSCYQKKLHQIREIKALANLCPVHDG